MAAVTNPETVSITVNDIPLEVPKGELIVESVKRLGLEIPIFCYHTRLKPVGMCRMCLVEVGFKQPDGSVRKMPKPQAGCTLPASDGMAIYTDTEMVHKDRKGVLEFLLVNHPLDCPVCDRGGECPLQNNTLFYGPSTSRFLEMKRHLPKAFPLSQYVTLDLERCIQCGRCVRFTEEISGDNQLAFRFRGAEMQPTTFELTNFESKFSGNVIEICPVGALTSAKYRFRARPWDLETKPGICTVCSNGCAVWFDHRLGKMVRINGRTNEAVNEEWTCDRGKFGHEFYNDAKRLGNPFLRNDDRLVPCEWSDVYGPILEAFQKGGDQVGALVGPMVANEGLILLKRLFAEAFGSKNLDFRFTNWIPDQEDPQANLTPIADFENARGVLLFGTSLADEEPILFLRVRKGWLNNKTKVVAAYDSATEADIFAAHVLRYTPGTESTLAWALESAASAMATGKSAPNLDQAVQSTGVSAELIVAAAKTLIETNAIVVTTHGLRNAPHAPDALKSLQSLAEAVGGSSNHYARGANDQGAISHEIAGQGGKNTRELLEAAASGQLKALWLVGVDLVSAYPDRALVEKALENVEFLVIQDIAETECLPFASAVLPMCAPAEQNGTYTSMEGRVQDLGAILRPIGDAKPAWRIFNEFLLRAGKGQPFFSAKEVLSR